MIPLLDRIRRNEQDSAEFFAVDKIKVNDLIPVLRVNTSLTTLRLRHKSFNPGDLKLIVNVIRDSKKLKLETFEINGIDIIDVRIIADLIEKNKTLTELKIERNNITELGAITNALRNNTTLLRISFLGNKIGDEGARMIADVLKQNRTLVSIELASCGITDAGWREIARTIVLNNSNTRILTDYGINFNLILQETIKQINFDAAYSQTVLELRRKGFDDDRIRYVMEMVLRTRNDDTWLFDPAERAAQAAQKRPRTEACIGCLIGTPQFYEEGDTTRRFCSSYCQIIYHFH